LGDVATEAGKPLEEEVEPRPVGEGVRSVGVFVAVGEDFGVKRGDDGALGLVGVDLDGEALGVVLGEDGDFEDVFFEDVFSGVGRLLVFVSSGFLEAGEGDLAVLFGCVVKEDAGGGTPACSLSFIC